MRIKRRHTLYNIKGKVPKVVYRVDFATQPAINYFHAKIYHFTCKFMWKTKLEKVQDYIFKKRKRWDSLDEDTKIRSMLFEMPSIQRDLRCYDLGAKNVKVYKTVAGGNKWPA